MTRAKFIQTLAAILALVLVVGGVSFAVASEVGTQTSASASGLKYSSSTPTTAPHATTSVTGSAMATPSGVKGTATPMQTNVPTTAPYIPMSPQAVSAAPTQKVSGYPGPSARPGIPPGPPVGSLCEGGSSAPNYVCGFMPGTQVTFVVDGVTVGTALAESNGCVAFTISVTAGLNLTINTFGSNGPKALGPIHLAAAVSTTPTTSQSFGPVPSGYGSHQIIVKGTGGPGPYRGKEVGLNQQFTVAQCGPPPTTPNGGGGGGGLAVTGAQITAFVMIGAGLLLAGGLIIAATRRRRHEQLDKGSSPPSSES